MGRFYLLLFFLLIGIGVGVFLVQRTTRIAPEAQEASLTDTSFEVPVLVIKYFPLTSDGQNIDINVTGDVWLSYSFIRQKTTDITNNLITAIQRATSYKGYQNSQAQPALTYTIVNTVEHTQAVPVKPLGERVRNPDYHKIMTDHNICSYVQNQNVKEVWIWAYQGPPKSDGQPHLGIAESKMSGPYGDISNSYRDNDLPNCGKTYRVYVFNYQRGTSDALESWGHQIEAEMDAVDRGFFRDKFQGNNYPQANNVAGRCGSIHNPPNARSEYDRSNTIPQQSDCLDWDPDSMGTLSQISCTNWTCTENCNEYPAGTINCQYIDPSINVPSAAFQIWNWQNLPGRGNTKTYQGQRIRNLWEIHANFDEVMANNRTFFLNAIPTPSAHPTPTPIVTHPPTPTPIVLPSPSATPISSPTPRPTLSPEAVRADFNNNGELDIFDYSLLVEHFGPRRPESGTNADTDSDGDVDIFDYSFFVTEFRRIRASF